MAMPELTKEWETAQAGPAFYPGPLSLARPAERRYYALLKRGMDVSIAAVGLILLCPLFVVVAVCLKLDDPSGPVFFRQVRIGKDGRPFQMVKFRTMVAGAETMLERLLECNEVEGKMFKMKNDPRITRFGRLLRRTSVDELPQLWNVLRGEMSLVGPRPPLPREVEQYTMRDRQRLLVVPGCTGVWQVSGRNALSFDEMVELDLYYIRHRSVRLDVVLLLKTIKVMIFPNNAY